MYSFDAELDTEYVGLWVEFEYRENNMKNLGSATNNDVGANPGTMRERKPLRILTILFICLMFWKYDLK